MFCHWALKHEWRLDTGDWTGPTPPTGGSDWTGPTPPTGGSDWTVPSESVAILLEKNPTNL